MANLTATPGDDDVWMWDTNSPLLGGDNSKPLNRQAQALLNRIEKLRLKAEKIVSVTDLEFGAKGDGITDDTEAIQAALNAARIVFIPAGTYLVSADLAISSNTLVFGVGAASVLKASANGISVIKTASTSDTTNILVRDLAIDGGGQTTAITAGVRGVVGIRISRARNVRIENVRIYKCGVKNGAAPTTDFGYGGYGMLIEARYGAINNIRIDRCTVSEIAGGGMNVGDGIYIAGYAPGAGTSYVDVVVSHCWVSLCGRHCYTVAGGAGETIPSGVKFIGCYADKAALCGLDVEEGHDVLVDGCTFKGCGNDQTYFDPAAAYGATYRLLAGVALGSDSDGDKIVNSTFDGCYYGVTEAGRNHSFVGCTFVNSVVSDIDRGLANSTTNLKLTDCNLLTAQSTLDYYQTGAGQGMVASGCTFAGTVRVAAMLDGAFDSCTFRRGFTVAGGSGGFSRNKFANCTFDNWAGVGIQCDGVSYEAADNVVDGCVFRGSGAMTLGIAFGYNSARRWKISNNKFIGLMTAGINHTNGNAVHAFDAIGNSFVGCAAGITVNQAINEAILSGNTFSGITAGYCIQISGINSGAPMRRTSIVSNIAESGCAKGINVTVSTGTFDQCVLALNNVNGATANKWDISGSQNTNGVTVNNVTA